jgi:hypothetical protein
MIDITQPLMRLMKDGAEWGVRLNAESDDHDAWVLPTITVGNVHRGSNLSHTIIWNGVEYGIPEGH